MLLEFVIDRGRLTVDHDHAAHGSTVNPHGTHHPIAMVTRRPKLIAHNQYYVKFTRLLTLMPQCGAWY